MPQPTAGLIEVTLEASLGTLKMANVFYYWNVLNDPPVSLIGLAEDFDDNTLAAISTIQAVGVSYDKVIVKDVLGDIPDLEHVPDTTGGLRTGSNMPTYVSIGYTYNGSTKETKKGSKRFGGQTEADIEGNAPISTFFDVMQTAEAGLQNSLGVSTVYVPVIASRPKEGRDFWIVNVVSNISADPLVTTQNTRKVI